MARSYKKEPWIKDRSKYAKRLTSKIMRKRTRERLGKEEYDVMPLRHECVNQYDVCDWKCLAGPEQDWTVGYYIWAKGHYRLRK